jgi:hypothetical protein
LLNRFGHRPLLRATSRHVAAEDAATGAGGWGGPEEAVGVAVVTVDIRASGATTVLSGSEDIRFRVVATITLFAVVEYAVTTEAGLPRTLLCARKRYL